MPEGRRQPRIIAGEARGRRLTVPPGKLVRPTSDRVKEAMFSALGHDRLSGARVVDLYAGSGALGLEALSRGASEVLLVERDAAAAQAIRVNIDRLGFAGRAVLRVSPVASVLNGAPPSRPFDLALLDPPYGTPGTELELVLRRLGSGEWLDENSTMVLERPSDSPPLCWPTGWGSTWERCYGDTLVLFAQHE